MQTRPLPPPLLEQQETSVDSLPVDCLCEHEPPKIDYAVEPLLDEEWRLRHSGWAVNRRKIYESLIRTHQTPARIDRFCQCGSGCVVQYSAGQERWRTVGNYCHDRFCVPCGNARSRALAMHLRRRVFSKTMRMVTLTLRHSQTPLTDQLDRLFSSFRKLRQRQSTHELFRGGSMFLEVKYSALTRTWHPHLHILCEGAFCSQKTIAEAWHAITGDSYIVHVKRVDSDDRMVTYVTKYASKPMDSSVFSVDTALDELVVALKGRRLNHCFGMWPKLDDKPTADEVNDWVTVGTLARLCNDAKDGDAVARSVLAMLRGWSIRDRRPAVDERRARDG